MPLGETHLVNSYSHAASLQLRVLRHIGRLASALVFALAACHSRPPQATTLVRDDLVSAAREWRATGGIAAARDRLSTALIKLDADGGSLERRVLRTNADKTLCLPDSLASLPPGQRSHTGIFLVLGYHTRAGRSEPVIQHVESYFRAEGWHAVLVPVPMHGTPDENAVAIQKVLAQNLPKVRRAIVVGFSKGGLDWMHWFVRHARELPEEERQKIQLMVSFAGALRGAAVASWMTEAGGLLPAVLRTRLRLHTARALPAVKSTAVDPWSNGQAPMLAAEFPQLRSVSIVAIPEGTDGQTHADPIFSRLARHATLQWKWLGPVDGLVETAGQVLPVEAHVPQHVVRTFGSHAVLDGRYANGSAVSKIYRKREADYWQGGEELLDDLIRALPRDWVWQ